MKRKKLRGNRHSNTKVFRKCILLFAVVFSFLSLWLCYRLDIFDLKTLFIQQKSELINQKKESIEKKTIEIQEKPTISKVSLIMVGDSLIHSAVYSDAKERDEYNFKPMLEYVKPIISSYDLAFYNQESILGGESLGLSSYPAFNSPYEVGDAFLDAGFNIVSLANNHTLDRGEQAIFNSVSYWKSKNVMFSGSASSFNERNQVFIMEKNGISYALLSYTDYTNGIRVPTGKEYLVNIYNEEQVKKDVESLRGKTDIIMVSMHFGEEYSHTISDRQKEIATYLSSLGVNIVIGHHPHVVQKTEMIGDTLVIYSLGNFISAQRGLERLTGLLYSVDIVKEEFRGNVKISFENQKATLVYTHSDYSNGYRHDFKLYPYKKLNDTLLSNYEMYYNQFMDIVVGNRQDVEKW